MDVKNDQFNTFTSLFDNKHRNLWPEQTDTTKSYESVSVGRHQLWVQTAVTGAKWSSSVSVQSNKFCLWEHI